MRHQSIINQALETIRSRFMDKVFVQNTGCWIWVGGKDPKGYGNFSLYGSSYKAHRVSWELANGPIPDDVIVMHKCDNPSCVNPHHLESGTQWDNMQDMKNKGRANHPKGEKHPLSRLTQQQVDEIRSLDIPRWHKARVARQYGITKPTLNNILAGRTWRG